MSKTTAFAIAVLAFCLGLFAGLLAMSSDMTEQKEEISILQAENAALKKRTIALHQQIEDRDAKNFDLKKDINYLEKKIEGAAEF